LLNSDEHSLIDARKVIAVRLTGGIGNQLFQYAAGKAASLRNNCPLALDLEGFRSTDGRIPREYMLHVMNIDAIVDPSIVFEQLVDYSENSFFYEPRFNKLGSGTRLWGYFQSQLYFVPYEARLRRELQLSIPESHVFQELTKQIGSCFHPVSIHVRRGDYATNPPTRSFHGMCLTNYYHRAIKIIDSISHRPTTYFIFADDRMEAMSMFDGLKSAVFVETPIERPWEDLFLMAKCADHILANSSLSWWASWLNPKREKTIVAPRRWFAPETMRSFNTCDLYPEGAIIL
jgi:hypothetical protein